MTSEHACSFQGQQQLCVRGDFCKQQWESEWLQVIEIKCESNWCRDGGKLELVSYPIYGRVWDVLSGTLTLNLIFFFKKEIDFCSLINECLICYWLLCKYTGLDKMSLGAHEMWTERLRRRNTQCSGKMSFIDRSSLRDVYGPWCRKRREEWQGAMSHGPWRTQWDIGCLFS